MTIETISRDVAGCFACDRMDHVHVLGPANGSPSARLMFIGEAPGRRGAARTGIPFTQDQSGKRFELLLAAAGILREDVFITNAILCNPLRDGLNRPPTTTELRTCSGWLARQIEVVDPEVVVTLGMVALKALTMSEDHSYNLRTDVGKHLAWKGRVLVPLYHPSPRTAAHRPFAQQLADFAALSSLPASPARR